MDSEIHFFFCSFVFLSGRSSFVIVFVGVLWVEYSYFFDAVLCDMRHSPAVDEVFLRAYSYWFQKDPI